jgi:hypothetical protein
MDIIGNYLIMAVVHAVSITLIYHRRTCEDETEPHLGKKNLSNLKKM